MAEVGVKLIDQIGLTVFLSTLKFFFLISTSGLLDLIFDGWAFLGDGGIHVELWVGLRVNEDGYLVVLGSIVILKVN